jgi:TonB family protein
MDAVRSACIWTGVGVSHVTLLVAAWGSGAERSSSSEGWVTVALIDSAEPKPATSLLSEVPAVVAGGSLPEVSFVKIVGPAVDVAAPSHVSIPAPSEPSKGIEIEPPRFNFRAEPVYPRAARLAGREGKVCLQLEISRNGTLHRTVVTLSSGDVALDRAAVEAAERSTYHPATSTGGPLDASAEATYRFVLR